MVVFAHDTHALGLELAVDEGTRETGAIDIDQYQLRKDGVKGAYRISFAFAWESGLPLAATWSS